MDNRDGHSRPDADRWSPIATRAVGAEPHAYSNKPEVDLGVDFAIGVRDGGSVVRGLMTGGIGFVRPSEAVTNHIDEKLERTAIEAARHKFSPEFIKRLDKLVVFRPLRMKVRISATEPDT